MKSKSTEQKGKNSLKKFVIDKTESDKIRKKLIKNKLELKLQENQLAVNVFLFEMFRCVFFRRYFLSVMMWVGFWIRIIVGFDVVKRIFLKC
jgi:hypothetical protein